MQKDYSNTNYGIQLQRLGYSLYGNVKDDLGRIWKYQSSHKRGGSIAYFSSLKDLVRWVRQVREVRLMVEYPQRHIDGCTVGAWQTPFPLLPN